MKLDIKTNTAKMDATRRMMFSYFLSFVPGDLSCAVRITSQQQKNENPTTRSVTPNFCKTEIDRDKTRAVPAADLIRQHGAAFGVGVLILLS
jgi:hypothetical protein